MGNVLEVINLVQNFNLSKGILDKLTFKNGKLIKEEKIVNAVNDISFTVKEGDVFSLVGESGCGKSTTAKTVIKLIEPKGGTIKFEGNDITNIVKNNLKPFKKKIQMIFQDPYASLNPRQQVIDIIMEPILFHNICSSKGEAKEKALGMLKKVGLREEQAYRYPHQFSGGQRQRIGIARALSVEPKFIIADEPVSALDISIQAQILNLLMDLQDEFNFSYLFIAHDLSVVKHISDKIGVMYLGKIVEKGTRNDIFDNPKHPYTNILLSAVPKLTGNDLLKSDPIKGEIPNSVNLPTGCYFHNRCPYAMPVCKEIMPIEKEVGSGHTVLCHLY